MYLLGLDLGLAGVVGDTESGVRGAFRGAAALGELALGVFVVGAVAEVAVLAAGGRDEGQRSAAAQGRRAWV